MKWFLQFMTIFLTFNIAQSQIAFYDALELSTYISTGKFDNVDSNFYKILKLYLPDEKSDFNNDALIEEYLDNPYFKELIDSSRGTALAADVALPFARFLPASVGGLDVTTFAEGLARFLVDRAKEELNVAFFDKLKNELAKYEELQTLFPTSYDFLQNIEPYYYTSMLQILKEGFQEDLKNLIFNFEKIFGLPKYRKILAESPALAVFMEKSA